MSIVSVTGVPERSRGGGGGRKGGTEEQERHETYRKQNDWHKSVHINNIKHELVKHFKQKAEIVRQDKKLRSRYICYYNRHTLDVKI